MSNARHKSAWIKQPVRIELLFERAHQAAALADLAPDVNPTFDLVGRAENEHLASSRLSHAPHLGELTQTVSGLESVEPPGVAMQSNDAVRRVRAQASRRHCAIDVGDQ